MLAGVLLYMRQFEIYSDRLNAVESDLDNVMPLLASLTFALAFGAIAFLVVRFQKHAQSFMMVIALPAFVLAILLPFSRADDNRYYDSYSTAEVGAADPSEPAVIVLVFDEFSRKALLDSTGEIDSARFPNFARLANRGPRRGRGTIQLLPHLDPGAVPGGFIIGEPHRSTTLGSTFN